jgi:anti-anti-sigma factor
VNSLSVSVERKEFDGHPYTVVVLVGQLADVIARRRMRRALESSARQGPHHLVLDLTGLELVDPAALHELVKASHTVRGLGGEIAMVGPRPEVAEIIQRAGADQLIPLYGSAEEAVTA